MEVNKVNTAEPMNGGVELGNAKELPRKVDQWTKFKNFLFYEITLELSPMEEKVFQEVHDFWHQDLSWGGVKEFLTQDIEITL